MPRLPSVLLVPAVLAMSAPASAVETYLVTVNPASFFTTDLELALPLDGTLIGNYDAVSNPGGTRTLPGIFGGSGNNAIPFTSDLRAATLVETVPAGTMVITIDAETLAVGVEELSLDLLGEKPGEIDLSLDILYSTFRTVNPSSLYPGGVVIPVPLGSGAITEISALQSGPGLGVLVPQGKNTFQFSVAVPVEVMFTADFQGQPIGGTPTPAVFPLVGTLTRTATGIALDVAASDSGTIVQPFDPPQTIENQPLALPTVIPAGGTANLLLNGAITEISVTQTLGIDLVATGVAACPPADLDGDCRVDSPDLAILLASWGARGPADLNGDGVVDSQDLALLLAAWGL
jgi:hypothetical protein